MFNATMRTDSDVGLLVRLSPRPGVAGMWKRVRAGDDCGLDFFWMSNIVSGRADNCPSAFNNPSSILEVEKTSPCY